MDYHQLKEQFSKHLSPEPRVFRSPGRINLIGEHTDYNNGFVLPAAVDKEICILMAPNGLEKTRIYSLDQHEFVEFSFTDYRQVKNAWALYLIGVIDELIKLNKKIEPVDIMFTGNIPMGAGMSSSAALECATVYAYNAIFNLQLTKWEMVKLAQAAENNYVGVKCGIMDQFASMFSQENMAMKLDCANLEYTAFPLNIDNYVFLLVDTMVKHSLASSEYNTRRQECEIGIKVLHTVNPNIQSLRDVSASLLASQQSNMQPTVFNRCSYVVDEIERVNLATEALKNNDLQKLGLLMYQTHEGLQHLYEVSCPEADFLVEYTKSQPHVLGARMMGGGFGGCTINLVEASKATQFEDEISKAYQTKFNIKPSIYIVRTSEGTSEITNL